MTEEKNNYQWQLVNNQLLKDNAVVELANGENMSVCRYKINKKVNVPLHSHEYEQIIYVVQGEMMLTVDDKQIFMSAGDVYVILGNVKHSAEITGIPFQSIESYYPIRTDLTVKPQD